MTFFRKQWEEIEKVSTTIWGTDWSYMKKQQGTADIWDGTETIPMHVIYEATTCKTWGINCNSIDIH